MEETLPEFISQGLLSFGDILGGLFELSEDDGGEVKVREGSRDLMEEGGGPLEKLDMVSEVGEVALGGGTKAEGYGTEGIAVSGEGLPVGGVLEENGHLKVTGPEEVGAGIGGDEVEGDTASEDGGVLSKALEVSFVLAGEGSEGGGDLEDSLAKQGEGFVARGEVRGVDGFGHRCSLGEVYS